jgi:hypothetical protein
MWETEEDDRGDLLANGGLLYQASWLARRAL